MEQKKAESGRSQEVSRGRSVVFQYLKSCLEHVIQFRSSLEPFFLYFLCLIQPHMFYRFQCSLHLILRMFRGYGQAVSAFDSIIGREGFVKIHQVMKPDGLIVSVTDQESPIAPVAVGVPDQIIKDIHHIIGISVKVKNIFHGIHVLVDGKYFNSMITTIFKKIEILAFSDPCFWERTICGEVIGNQMLVLDGHLLSAQSIVAQLSRQKSKIFIMN